MADLSSWFTHTETAGKLGISERTLKRVVADGEHKDFPFVPEVRKRQRGDGRKPENVYNPGDVEKLVSQRNTRLVPAADPGPLELESDKPHPLVVAIESCIKRLQVSSPLYLSIDQAHEVSGLSKTFLRRVAFDIGFRDGRSWRIPRSHLANTARMVELARNHHAIDDAEENPRWENI